MIDLFNIHSVKKKLHIPTLALDKTFFAVRIPFNIQINISYYIIIHINYICLPSPPKRHPPDEFSFYLAIYRIDKQNTFQYNIYLSKNCGYKVFYIYKSIIGRLAQSVRASC